jgi:hypothetical protein
MDMAGNFIDNDFCFACGGKNPLGLHLQFFADGDLFCTRVMPQPHWQGFQGVVHGGLQSTIMDDLMSNHLFRIKQQRNVTGELTLRYKKPVPIDRELLFSSQITGHRGRIWELAGRLAACEAPDIPLTLARARFVEVPDPVPPV